MQPVHSAMSALVSPSMPGSAITSETAKRPPGRSTRAAFPQHGVLVGSKVDHAVGDHHIDAVIGQRDFFEVTPSAPAPEPRSRTTSPGCRSATAVGTPQPSEAETASGRRASSLSSYKPAPKTAWPAGVERGRTAARRDPGRRAGGFDRGRSVAAPDSFSDIGGVVHRSHLATTSRKTQVCSSSAPS
jgi:hypothetical protein